MANFANHCTFSKILEQNWTYPLSFSFLYSFFECSIFRFQVCVQLCSQELLLGFGSHVYQYTIIGVHCRSSYVFYVAWCICYCPQYLNLFVNEFYLPVPKMQIHELKSQQLFLLIKGINLVITLQCSKQFYLCGGSTIVSYPLQSHRCFTSRVFTFSWCIFLQQRPESLFHNVAT